MDMADPDEIPETSTQLHSLTAEYKDGQLQIIEVRPFDKSDVSLEGESSTILPALEADDQSKYVELKTDDRSMMQLDLLNLTLIRCEDGTESYRLVANGETSPEESDATVTCVLASSDNEGEAEAVSQEAYVMVSGEQGSIMFLQPPPEDPPPQITIVDTAEEQPTQPPNPPKLSPTEILERAKALQKAKALLTQNQNPPRKRGRKRKSDLPSPHELLSSPNFKLFLYSCKMCNFKCNAIKEMTAHKAIEHTSSKWRAPGGRGAPITLQCARCPYKGMSHSQLMTHVQQVHLNEGPSSKQKVYLNTEEVAAADILVCGACGFESASRLTFKTHIEDEHGATTC